LFEDLIGRNLDILGFVMEGFDNLMEMEKIG
jgi:hypothetical protein